MGTPVHIDDSFYRAMSSISPGEQNWEYMIDTFSAGMAARFLIYAPFRLTAVVNRLDLRGNASYTSAMSNTGETRFIYTLVNLYDEYDDLSGSILYAAAGMPPVQQNQGVGAPGFLDWQGMNVIFEFGNVQTDLCGALAYAQKWLHLSQLPFAPYSSDFNDYLDTAITSMVIKPNAAAGLGKPNGSAINRIRTNERIFFHVPGTTGEAWSEGNWQFRQFELDASGKIGQVPLTNTPINTANNPTNLSPGLAPPTLLPYDQALLLDWMFSNVATRNRILLGNHSMPETYALPGMPLSTLRSPAGMVDWKFPHYWEMSWDPGTVPSATHYTAYASSTTLPNPDSIYREMRHQVSLNTCQGCHAGETKTLFTQIMPLGYGQPARYWETPSDVNTKNIDTRFGGNSSGAYDYPAPGPYQNVSAFLTGRKYQHGAYQSDGTLWPPMTLLDVYNAYSPNNGSMYGTLGVYYSYNDLKRREEDLCRLINNGCDPTPRALPLGGKVTGGNAPQTSLALFLFNEILRMPLPPGAH